MLLNVVIFMWYGAVCPWHKFLQNDTVPLYRLVILGILILLLRRLPYILASRKMLPQLEDVRQTLFMGFFGPIGCSAIFYLYITVEFLESLSPGGGEEPRWDVSNMAEEVRIVCWFLIVCSVVRFAVNLFTLSAD
jgi:sodium/hydrogen antiporter